MNPLAPVAEARAVGQEVTAEGLEQLRRLMQEQMRRSLGMRGGPPPPACRDPEAAFFAPGSIVREINGDIPAMLIGGVAALLMQVLHPLTMAGVDQHSNYRTDPLGRLERTANFLAATTFQSRAEAEEAIARVRRIHASVAGFASDGRPYSAADPALLTWVHAVEVHCFLTSAVVYGPRRFTEDECDGYVEEMARVGDALGAVGVPRRRSELASYFDSVRPELCLTPEARGARNFLLRGIGRWPHEVASHGLLVAAAQGILPPWARRQLHLPAVPAADRLAVRPAVRTIGAALRWVAGPPRSHPSPREDRAPGDRTTMAVG